MDSVCKLLSLLVVGFRALHPDHICVRSICDCSVDGTATSTLVPVEAFPRPWGVPVPVDVDTGEAFGNSSRLSVALSLNNRTVFLNETFLVDMNTCVDRVNHVGVKQFQSSLRHPLVLDGLKLFPRFARLFGRNHQVVQGLKSRICGAKNECVVSGINSRSDQCGGFRVRSGDSKQVGTYIRSAAEVLIRRGRNLSTHNVRLRTDCNQPVYVLADRYKDLACHVPTFLCSRRLVFNVYSRSTALDEELRQLHDCRQPTMSGVSVGNYRS